MSTPNTLDTAARMAHASFMAQHYYTATLIHPVTKAFQKFSFSGKAAALKHGETIAREERAQVRIATPAGNLVRYFDCRVQTEDQAAKEADENEAIARMTNAYRGGW